MDSEARETHSDRPRRWEWRVGMVALLVAAAILWQGPSPAWAHVPFLEPSGGRENEPPSTSEAIRMPDPSVSRALYGTLAPAESFDAYYFEAGTSEDIPIQLLIPVEDELRGFRPAYAVAGAGIEPGEIPPGAPGRYLEQLVASGEGQTGFQVTRFPEGEPSTFFEPFSFERYWKGPEITVPLQAGGVYHLVVWSEEAPPSPAPYAFGLGTREEFTLGSAADSVVVVTRLKLGLYGQEEFNLRGVVLAGALTLSLVALAVLAVAAVRRRRAT